MACTSEQLNATMNRFLGGSLQRFRHPLARDFMYTEGVRSVADLAGAYWLLDIVGTEFVPVFSQQWQEGRASIGAVQLEVTPEGSARLWLQTEDDQPPACEHHLVITDFPQGTWTFFLGTDELGADRYITNMMLEQEY